MVEQNKTVQIPRVVYPFSKQEMQERYQIKPVPEPNFVDQDGAWYSQEHKQYMMSQKSYWEE